VHARDHLGVAEFVASQGGTVDDCTYESKALADGVPVKRWTVYPDPGS
jgi:hypothetical protein